MILRRFAPYALKAILSLFCLWVGGFVYFFLSIPQHVADQQTVTEAIIVLTGGRERLKTGFELLCAQRAKVMFISGVHPGEGLKSLLKSFDISKVPCTINREQLASSTHLGHTAKNTKGNAQETAAWVNKMSITSLRLVTAAYHMPRSLMEFKHALPQTTIISHPVFPYSQNQVHRWRKGGLLYLIFSEYNKFLWGFLRTYVRA